MASSFFKQGEHKLHSGQKIRASMFRKFKMFNAKQRKMSRLGSVVFSKQAMPV